jgi:NADH:ubiquinone reductase (H+-translocating)
MRVIILGGGYAGLSCLLQLRRQQPDLELHLLDSNPCHIKNNHLHQTLDRPLQDYSVPFAALAERLGFTFHQQACRWNSLQLPDWQQSRALPLDGGALSFDLLVLATGAQPLPLPMGDFCYGLGEFRRGMGPELMDAFRERIGDRPAHCTVVGSGPSGIQFLFALHERLSHWRIVNQLQLVTLDRSLVPDLPEGFHQKLLAAMRTRGIRFLPATRFIGQQGTCLRLQPLGTSSPQVIESDLTLLFPGVAPQPTRVKTNPFGQILQDGVCLEHIFATGDCADYAGPGLNSLTAQAAVRKGRLVAANIAALAANKQLTPYSYRERGFFLALGPFDGLGWLGWRRNLVSGLTAMAVKELLEAQYDLLLEGLDTYPS